MALLITALSINVRQLASYLAFSDYAQLVEEISEGRFAPSDLDRISSFLAYYETENISCRSEETRVFAILALYRADLLAAQKGVSPFDYSPDLGLQLARAQAMRAIQGLLRCSPMDGDMWLRLALVGRTMGLEQSRLDTYLAWSRTTAPHEGGVQRRREDLSASERSGP